MIYPNLMAHFKTWLTQAVLADDPKPAALDFIPPQRIPSPVCCGCGASGPHQYRIRLFEGYVLSRYCPAAGPPVAACAACFTAQQAISHREDLEVFRQMRKEAR